MMTRGIPTILGSPHMFANIDEYRGIFAQSLAEDKLQMYLNCQTFWRLQWHEDGIQVETTVSIMKHLPIFGGVFVLRCYMINANSCVYRIVHVKPLFVYIISNSIPSYYIRYIVISHDIVYDFPIISHSPPPSWMA